MTDNLEFQSALDNPAQTNALVQSILSDDAPLPDRVEYPSAPAIPDSVTSLPAGLEKDGKVLRRIEVRELTGLDEEKIAKARATGNAYRWLNAILEAGTASLEGKPVTVDDLDKMVIGDREFLLIQVRKATFGSEVELGLWHCPDCKVEYQAKVNLDDLVMRELSDRYVHVPLKDGRKAIVRVPTGADQDVYMNVEGETAEQNTALLERVVEAITDSTGIPQPIIGMAHSTILGMGVMDRRAILAALDDCQPGPRYDDLKVKHDCGAEFPAAIGVVSLFPGL